MRCQSPRSELINSMAGLYESGLSLAEVGARTGTSPGTVRRYLLIRGIQMRDSHGRQRYLENGTAMINFPDKKIGGR
jgi:hypothetical protein